MPLTLQEVATKTGQSYDLLKKHAQRGRIKTYKEGGRIMVADADLDAYLASQELGAVVEVAGRPATIYGRDLGNTISRLPTSVQSALLEAMPTSKNGAGHPELVEKAVANLGPGYVHQSVPEVDPEDPHCGFPVGYRHASSPRWGRTSEDTWELNGATLTWTGLFWVAGGSWANSDRSFGEGISPASPHAEMRPLTPNAAQKSK